MWIDTNKWIDTAKPHPPRHELVGQQFGRLTVLGRVANSRHNKTRWACRCECGALHTTLTALLLGGRAQSCGCRQRDTSRTHGLSASKTYRSWHHMRQRCQNQNLIGYKDYGGRGIQVCKRWETFENFLADMGERPEGMSIERKDNNKGYSPDNCVWATSVQQSANRRCTVFLEHQGVRKPLTEWAKQIGASPTTLHVRLTRGWSVAKTVTTPPNQHPRGPRRRTNHVA